MWIDLIWCFLMLIALFKGMRKGIIQAVFSFIGIIIGLAAALKFSAIVADAFKHSFNVETKWWPFIAFFVVFTLSGVLVRMVGNILSKGFDMVALGWINKAGGIMLFSILYTLVYSVFLFYYEKLFHISDSVKSNSVLYPYIASWGEWTLELFGKIIPAFKNVFHDIENFFEIIGDKIDKSQ
ncbi:MAG: CvpA family protein [Chitinophagaceae bacterium]